jgi:hypothetical protein
MRSHDCQQDTAYRITSSNVTQDNKHSFICRPTFGICYYTLGTVDCTVSKVE